MKGQRTDNADSSRGKHSRLPAIAPAAPSSSSSSPASSSGPSGLKRNRLPPRSKSGCWICRTRKVKCDEQRPSCGQCLRLGHTCDYNPRLSFRDDTPRVVERMQEVSKSGSSIWDPNAQEQDSRQNRSVEDLLPPFAALTTDEERERKAELQDPGTYHVIANPRSFESLPGYRDDSPTSREASQRLSRSPSIQVERDTAGDATTFEAGEGEDPNVVILKTFEDPVGPTRRGSTQSSRGSAQLSRRSITNPSSSASSQLSFTGTPRSASQLRPSPPHDQHLSMLDVASNGGRDAQLLVHYRTKISPLIFRDGPSSNQRLVRTSPSSTGSGSSGRNEDIFEAEARTFPALFHAMMALAALSLAYHNRTHSADALEHYQKVIPALQSRVQSSQDSYCDGALLTHFMLLLYEIAAAGQRESNMWQHHINQLLRILSLRRQAYGAEPFEFIPWTVCPMDVYALLTLSGTGNFAEVLMSQNMLPSPDSPPLTPGQHQAFYPEREKYFSAIVKVNQEVFALAIQVGQLARTLREEAAQREHGNCREMVPDSVYLMARRTRVQTLQRLLLHSPDKWRTEYPGFGNIESPGYREFAWIQHQYLLYRACIIYAHTSMFPGQLSDQQPDYVEVCTSEIIQAAHMILSQERFDMGFILFPLFMAGFATDEDDEKQLALGMIRGIERHCFGPTTEICRRLLETIYQKQRAATMGTGDASSVDWVEEIEMSGQGLVLYGL